MDALQILLLVLLEMPCFCWTKLVFLQLGSAKPIATGPMDPWGAPGAEVHDKGGLLIFLFGTAFGVAAGRVLGAAEMAWLNGSQRSSAGKRRGSGRPISGSGQGFSYGHRPFQALSGASEGNSM